MSGIVNLDVDTPGTVNFGERVSEAVSLDEGLSFEVGGEWIDVIKVHPPKKGRGVRGLMILIKDMQIMLKDLERGFLKF
jgi:hypothetical protein